MYILKQTYHFCICLLFLLVFYLPTNSFFNSYSGLIAEPITKINNKDVVVVKKDKDKDKDGLECLSVEESCLDAIKLGFNCLEFINFITRYMN